MQWQAERSTLLQRIQLLESTIGEMKERELKIKRINETLLHSLSVNSDSQSATNSTGLWRVLQQQESELNRLHQRLREASKSKSAKEEGQPGHYKSLAEEPQAVIALANEQKNGQASSVELDTRIRLPKQYSVANQASTPCQALPEQNDGQVSALRVQESALSRFKFKSKSNRLQLPRNAASIEPRPAQKLEPGINELLRVKRTEGAAEHFLAATQRQQEMNISGYVNFLRANPGSINYQLLRLHPPASR